MKLNLTDRMAQVSEILIQLAGTPIPSQQLQILADLTNLVVPHEFLAFCLIEEEANHCLVFPLVGSAREALPERPYALNEGVLGRVLSRQQSEIIHLPSAAEGLPELEGILCAQGLNHALLLPIRQEKNVLGALYLASEKHQYSGDDLQIGQLLAAGLASSLETSRFYQRLADERSTLAAVLASTQDGVLVVNERGVVLLANPAFEAMFDLKPGVIAGRPLIEFIAQPPVLSAISAKGDSSEISLGDGRVAQACSAQVMTEFGEFVGMATVFRDITLLKELEEMKNEFVNTVSHDLKNPINAIMLSGELLTKAGTLNEQQLKLQERIEQTAVYMNELVSELLDLGKIQAGLDLHPRTFNLIELIQDVNLTLASAAAQKKQKIHFSPATNMSVFADDRRLKQVLLNLISNAIKYTPHGGEISISISEEKNPNSVEVAISDTGIGIAPQDLPYVFDKFYRVQNDQTKDIKGTGLGLAITQSIIEAHNGRIWVNSTPGQGTTFVFSLPTPAASH